MRAFAEGEFRAFRGLDNFARLHFAGIDPGKNDAGRSALGDGVGEFIASIQDKGAIRRERGGEFALLLRNGFARAHEFHMRDADVGDDRDIRMRQLRERGDLARMIHSDLPNADLVAGGGLEHGLRQTDVVVEIAFGFGDPKTMPQDGGGKILRARFAVAPGNGDDLYA